MDWQKEMDELRRREEFAEELGGAERVKRQHDGGRLTIRERIDRLVDAGSFHEIGKIAGKATYDGNNDLEELTPVQLRLRARARSTAGRSSIGGDDFTVRGGSADATIKGKHNFSASGWPTSLRVPLIRIVEGSGGGGSVKTIETTGRANVPGVRGWELVVQQHGHRAAGGAGPRLGRRPRRRAPRRRALLGDGEGDLGDVRRRPAGGRAARARSSTKNELGGWQIQLQGRRGRRGGGQRGGGLRRARAASSPTCRPRSTTCRRAGRRPTIRERREEWLFDAIPRDIRKVYKMRAIVEEVVDQGSFFEMGQLYGRSVVTGFARLDGWPVAVMASDPMFYGGGVDGRHLPEGRALRRHGADLPSAGRLSRATARAS